MFWYTDKKLNKIFLVYKEIQNEAVAKSYTVKKAVELLDVPSKITFLKSNKYNGKV